ncbi:hypothetical protein [Streptomyces sp. NRRL B-3648]|uniref:hypothetical protein n=1 Tax=Streptomyces sp. NRRL B-3648 TaxID=1519493 RepID=UPI000B0F15FD|nr:hypothetical protein [Streptomyces sp. NRRL B-3648]
MLPAAAGAATLVIGVAGPVGSPQGAALACTVEYAVTHQCPAHTDSSTRSVKWFDHDLS